MNTNDLKTFEILPFGAKDNPIGAFPEALPVSGNPTLTPVYSIMPVDSKSLLPNLAMMKRVRVVDTDTNFPLENVNVSVVGTGRGAITNQDGYANIEAISENDKIRFSHVAYAPKEFAFKNLEGQVKLEVEYLTQDEIVIIAKPKPATTTAATDSKTNWMKWVGIGIAGLVLLNMASEDKPKKVKV